MPGAEGDGEPEQQLGPLFLLPQELQQHRLDDAIGPRVQTGGMYLRELATPVPTRPRSSEG
jgi:hypothetical protein